MAMMESQIVHTRYSPSYIDIYDDMEAIVYNDQRIEKGERYLVA